MKNYFLALMCFLALGFAPSCKDDEEDCAATAANAQDESAALQTAAIAYGSNPSTANCTAYKNAFQAYIDAVRPLSSCPGLTQAERDTYQQQLDDAEADLAALPC